MYKGLKKMMLLIPSIELSKGKATEQIQGVQGTEELYLFLKSNPQELVKLIRRENTKCLNLYDKDSFLKNDDVEIDKNLNWQVIKQMCQNTDIPIQLESDVQTIEQVEFLFNLGICRLSLTNNLFSNTLLKEALNRYGCSKVSIVIDADDILDLELLLETIFFGFSEFKYLRLVLDLKNSEYFSIQTLSDYFSNLITHNPIVKKNQIKFTLKNFIQNSEELYSVYKLEKFNIDSVIIGKPILENTFPCQQIWRNAEAILEKIPTT